MSDASEHSQAPGAPLSGRSVVVTRARAQSRELAEPLEALGAEVIACPVIEIVDPPDFRPVDEAIAQLSAYDWAVFTSTNAVKRFFARLEAAGLGAGGLATVKVAAVGSATAEALRRRGVIPHYTPPKEFRAESLAQELARRGAGPGWRVLFPRALEAREVIPEVLRAAGATVDVVPVYRTVPATPDTRTLTRLSAGGFDAVTFTSPSTVRSFVTLLERGGLDPARTLARPVIASIGPVTTEALIGAGLRADVEAEPSTVAGLVDALVARLLR